MWAWEPVAALLLSVCALSLAASAVSHVLLWCVVRRERQPSQPSAAPPERVAILKPLCGVEADLAENLANFAQQTHRELGLVFGVADARDEVSSLARQFCDAHPELDTRLSIGEAPGLLNPKVALLTRMSRFEHADWLVVSDSNVRVAPDYVARALSHAAPDVGLITHLVAGDGGHSLAARLENLQLNCFIAPAVCAARFIAGRTCVIGKSMFLRRELLEKLGGFGSAGGFLAEDYVLGQAVERAGYRVATVATPVRAWHAGWTWSRFVNRHLRWAVMRRRISRPAYVAEPLLLPATFLLPLLALALWRPELGINPAWLVLSLLLEAALAAITFTRMTGQRAPLLTVAVNPLRQVLTFGIWVTGWFIHHIDWRGKVYRVGPNSVLWPVRPLSERVPDEA